MSSSTSAMPFLSVVSDPIHLAVSAKLVRTVGSTSASAGQHLLLGLFASAASTRDTAVASAAKLLRHRRLPPAAASASAAAIARPRAIAAHAAASAAAAEAARPSATLGSSCQRRLVLPAHPAPPPRVAPKTPMKLIPGLFGSVRLLRPLGQAVLVLRVDGAAATSRRTP